MQCILFSTVYKHCIRTCETGLPVILSVSRRIPRKGTLWKIDCLLQHTTDVYNVSVPGAVSTALRSAQHDMLEAPVAVINRQKHKCKQHGNFTNIYILQVRNMNRGSRPRWFRQAQHDILGLRVAALSRQKHQRKHRLKDLRCLPPLKGLQCFMSGEGRQNPQNLNTRLQYQKYPWR